MIPLPEPTVVDPGAEGAWLAYTEDQMQKYGAACAEEMRERAAKACEDLVAKHEFHSNFTCAAAIRALKTS